MFFFSLSRPDYEVRNEACKYNFIIEPFRRHILIDVIVEFPLILTERRNFEVTAECYNEIRTSSSTSSNNSTTSSSLSNTTKKSSKAHINNQTSKLISQYVYTIVFLTFFFLFEFDCLAMRIKFYMLVHLMKSIYTIVMIIVTMVLLIIVVMLNFVWI